MNFSISYVQPPSDHLTYGDRLHDGSWTGLVGMLQRCMMHEAT